MTPDEERKFLATVDECRKVREVEDALVQHSIHIGEESEYRVVFGLITSSSEGRVTCLDCRRYFPAAKWTGAKWTGRR